VSFLLSGARGLFLLLQDAHSGLLVGFSGCPILPGFGRVGGLTSLPPIEPAQEAIPFLDRKKLHPCKPRKDAAPNISKSPDHWPGPGSLQEHNMSCLYSHPWVGRRLGCGAVMKLDGITAQHPCRRVGAGQFG